MSLAAVKDTLGIVNAAAQILDNRTVRGGVKATGKALKFARDASQVGGALTQLSSQTTIISRAFIDESVTDEIVLPNLMKSIHEWYAAQILAALHLSSLVDSKRTVQNVMSVIQDGRHDRTRDLMDSIVDRAAGMESFLTNYLGDGGSAFVGLESMAGPMSPSDVAKKAMKERDAATDELNKLRGADNNVNLRSVSASENRIGPMGELFEIKMTNPNGTGQSVTVPVYVQMQPSIVPSSVAPRFVDMNVSPTTWQRWTQMRAGELSFWKDFVAKKDIFDRKRSFLKDPQSAAVFGDFLSTVAKKDKYAMGDVTNTASRSSNLANSVVIFSEDSIAQAKADSAIDLHSANDRHRYFRDTYTMAIAIVDVIHQRVTVYFNGLEGSLDCAYSDFKPKDSKFDPKDFMQALTAFSSNSVGRLR